MHIIFVSEFRPKQKLQKPNEPIELNKLNFKCVYAEYNDIMRAHLGVNPFWIWHLLAKPLFRKIETLELKATSVNNG